MCQRLSPKVKFRTNGLASRVDMDGIKNITSSAYAGGKKTCENKDKKRRLETVGSEYLNKCSVANRNSAVQCSAPESEPSTPQFP